MAAAGCVDSPSSQYPPPPKRVGPRCIPRLSTQFNNGLGMLFNQRMNDSLGQTAATVTSIGQQFTSTFRDNRDEACHRLTILKRTFAGTAVGCPRTRLRWAYDREFIGVPAQLRKVLCQRDVFVRDDFGTGCSSRRLDRSAKFASVSTRIALAKAGCDKITITATVAASCALRWRSGDCTTRRLNKIALEIHRPLLELAPQTIA
jgi:hypothetical protein